MKNRYLHLIKFDLKVLVLNKLTLFQVLFMQVFLAHFFTSQLKVFQSAGPGFWGVYLLAAGFFVLNISNFFSFEFTFSKVRRFRITESLFAAPVGCRTWLYSAAAACFIFNASNLLLHLGIISALTGAGPLGLPHLPALLSVFFVHSALILLLGLASLRTGFYAAANTGVFILTVFGLTAFGFFKGFEAALSAAAARNILLGSAAFFAAAATAVHFLADTEAAGGV
ncbi:MAG: hypothetical protein FD189_482 [Elusimicrobia bacterium]|nr:MAG: hypothetical protein FD154_1760 [Elusimicrobiota bacterium]KAF0157468.1 MAG: hypothetical protein FD189_482 [Elusimicrobiota bacterium]